MKKGNLYKKYIRPSKNHIIYLFGILLIWFLNWIARKTALDIGNFAGFLTFYLSGKLRRRGVRNIRTGLSLEKVEAFKLCRRCFMNAGKNLVDGIRMVSISKSDVLKLVEVKGIENFNRVYDSRKGVIGILGHIGSFELMPAYLSYTGYKVGAVAREMYDPRLDRILVGNRRRAGVKIIKATSSPKHLLKLLHNGYGIGFLMDLESSVVSVKEVTFLNRMVKVPVGPVRIAMHSGLPLSPMAIYRKKDNSFIFYIGKPVELAELDDRKAALDINLQKAVAALEKLIKMKPDEWVWMNSKWK